MAFFNFHIVRALFSWFIGNENTEIRENVHNIFLVSIIREMLDSLDNIEQNVKEIQVVILTGVRGQKFQNEL